MGGNQPGAAKAAPGSRTAFSPPCEYLADNFVDIAVIVYDYQRPRTPHNDYSGGAHVTASLSHLAPDGQVRDLFARLSFVTASPALIPILRQASKAASVSDVTVLLEGETGTGKQVLARAIHHLDQKRSRHPFVTVNCCAVAEGLVESEIFGHHRGAFTGAVSGRRGLFHAADHGTLFLDDVNDLPLHLQPKLLDVIQRGVVRSVGSDHEVRVDVRIIAACNQPLRPLVLQNQFRSDLYHRLNVIRLRLPALRERPQDIEPLVLAFASRYHFIYGPITSVEPALVRFLAAQPFTGNVRELENAVQRMLFGKAEGASLGLADWLAQSSEERTEERRDLLADAAQSLWEAISQRGLSFPQALRQIEKRLIETALRAGGRTRREIARQLRTSERTLYHKMRAYHLTSRASV